MNSLFLLLIAGVIFTFGYRFFAKLLSVWVFRLDPKYSTPSANNPDPEYGDCSHHILFSHHVAALAAVSTVLGAAITLLWGWIPAFLIVVVGTAAAGGTYGIGSLWISIRHQGHGPAHLAGVLFGQRLGHLLRLLFFVFLLIVIVVAINLLAGLLVQYPTMVIPFALQIPLALIIGIALKRSVPAQIAVLALFIMVFVCLSAWMFDHTTVAMGGALNVDIAGRTILPIDNHLVWVGIIFITIYFAVRLPMAKLMRPRGFLSGVQLGLLLLLFVIGLLIAHPKIVAPSIHHSASIPDVLPWIFIAITGGALSGFHLLIASGISAKQMQHETEAKYIGFGGALVDAAVALSAIVIFASGFSDQQAWKSFYQSWDQIQNLLVLLQGYINGMAQLFSHLGLSTAMGRTLVAVIFGSLLLTAIEAVLRLQKQIVSEWADQFSLSWLKDSKNSVLSLLGLIVIAVLAAKFIPQLNGFWPLLGPFSIFTVCMGLLLITAMLNGFKRPLGFTLIPFVLLFLFANWALITQLYSWWGLGYWALFSVAVLLFIIEAWVIIEVLPILPGLFRKLYKSP